LIHIWFCKHKNTIQDGPKKLSSKLLFIIAKILMDIYRFIFHKGTVVTQLRCGGIFSNHFYYKFSTECAGAKILKIGWYVAKIWTKVCGLLSGATLYIFEWVFFSKHSVVTLVLSCRISEILQLLYAKSHFFGTPSLFRRKFRGVPLGVNPWCLGCKERTPQANQPWNYFRRFPTYVITIHQRYRQMDGRHCHSITVLCVASHSKNMTTNFHTKKQISYLLDSWAALVWKYLHKLTVEVFSSGSMSTSSRNLYATLSRASSGHGYIQHHQSAMHANTLSRKHRFIIMHCFQFSSVQSLQ